MDKRVVSALAACGITLAVCGLVVALSGAGILASGNGIDLLSWLMVAVAGLMAASGIILYAVSRYMSRRLSPTSARCATRIAPHPGSR